MMRKLEIAAIVIGLLLILLALTELPVTIRTAQGGTSIVGRINLVAQYA